MPNSNGAGSEAERARLRGEADARAGQAMNIMYWHKSDRVKDAYRDGYQAIVKPPRPPKPKSANPRPKLPDKSPASVRKWK